MGAGEQLKDRLRPESLTDSNRAEAATRGRARAQLRWNLPDLVRILHCIHSTRATGGGPIEGIRQLATAHMESARRVDIACLDSAEVHDVEQPPIRVHGLGPGLGSYGYSPRWVPWLREHAPTYDAVVVNGLWQYSSFGTWRALRTSAQDYFIFPHGMLDPWFKRRYPLKHLKKCLYWPWAESRVLRDAKAVLFTCEEERQLACQSFRPYRCREVVVNYGTSSPPEKVEKQRNCFLERFPALQGKRMVLFLSRIHEKKGCDLLIEAFARLRERLSDGGRVHLVLAGPCADQRYLRGLQSLADRLLPSGSVTWAGMLVGDAKWGAFRACEVFALPSHQENFGIAVAEALACSRPVLISDRVNIWREIQEDGAGLVAADTLEGTQTLLEKWFAMRDAERVNMRSRALLCFRQRFEIHQAARKLVEVFLEPSLPA